MDLIDDYGWLLSAVIVAGWILTWRVRRWMRWTLLGVSAAASVLCFAIGALTYGTPLPDVQTNCSSGIGCPSTEPAAWMSNGIVGLGCSVTLMIITSVVELVLAFRPARSE